MLFRSGINDQEIVDLAAHFRHSGHILRLIEFMDVGTTNGWRLDAVVSAAEILETIGGRFPLEPLEPSYRGEVARRYRYVDGAGEIGLIASVTQPFCGDCTRLRVSAEGAAYTCLFATEGTDLKSLIRSGASDGEWLAAIADLWGQRSDRYSEIRSQATESWERIEMSYIGG